LDTRSRSTESTEEVGEGRRVKRSRPFVAWLSFFLGLAIVGGCLLSAAALILAGGQRLDVLKAPFMDYRDTSFFRELTRYYFSMLLTLANDHSREGANEPFWNTGYVSQMLKDEGENLLYCIVVEPARGEAGGGEVASGDGTAGEGTSGDGTGAETTGSDATDGGGGPWSFGNIDGGLASIIGPDNMPVLPDGYGYYWYLDGERIWVINEGVPIDTDRLDSGYRGLIPSINTGADQGSSLAGVRALLAVRDVLVENPYGHSRYYQEQKDLYVVGRVALFSLAAGIVLIAYGIAKRKERHIFESKMASWSGRLWLEVKIVFSAVALSMFFGPVILGFDGSGGSVAYILVAAALATAVFGWFYVMLVDLRYNGTRFLTHNSVSSLLAWYRRYESRYPWQKRMLKRFYALLGVEALLAFMAICLAVSSRSGLGVLFAVLLAGVGVYLLLRYLRGYERTLGEWGRLMDHIRKIRNGDMETKLDVAPDADVAPAAQDLNGIQEGMSLAVSEKVKSERMKVELITNVSHDLKTPLTSIISYLDLLSKENGLPERANDYVGVLTQKAERLKNLIQDLFELSRATSNDLALDMKRLDLVRLTRQVLADMEEPINDSGLVFRVNLPDEPVYTVSDGGKLYRVLQNLISNALKYSLQGSRVFVELLRGKNESSIVIKNTANYEMDFTADEIMQRFTRGDRSRSTEGSGLGLSIAKSFTEACGGHFAVTIDGDQFKAQVTLRTEGDM
jgi:signal transduction histidine kinase